MSSIFEEAENAVETKPEYSTWGECILDMYEAVWNKDARQWERFDASIHQPSERVVRAEIAIIPLDEMNARFNTEAKFSVTGYSNREWAAVTLPSIKATNTNLRDLNGKFVKITRKPNGKFYDKKVNGQPTGEKKELTDFLFMKVFASGDECRLDYLSRGGEPTAASEDVFPSAQPTPVPAVPNVTPDAILLKFAQAIIAGAVKNAGKDIGTVTTMAEKQINTNPMFAGRYSVNSPEILEMIITACA